jgi:hypothetical protein
VQVSLALPVAADKGIVARLKRQVLDLPRPRVVLDDDEGDCCGCLTECVSGVAMVHDETAAYSARPRWMLTWNDFCVERDRNGSNQMSESGERSLQRRSVADRLISRAENFCQLTDSERAELVRSVQATRSACSGRESHRIY